MEHETPKLQQYQLNDKLLFSYCDRTNVFVMFNEFIMEIAQSIPPATLQRKKWAVIQPHEERHCSEKYLQLFKTVNAVGESTNNILVTTLTQAQLLIGLLTGRKLKMSTIQQVESTAMEIEDARMLLKCVTMENLAQFPTDRQEGLDESWYGSEGLGVSSPDQTSLGPCSCAPPSVRGLGLGTRLRSITH